MKTRMVAALLIASLALAAQARFMNRSVKVPVDRAVANVEKWIKEKPGDAQAYYVLGRLHAMAWAYGPELNLWRPVPPGDAPPLPRGELAPAATQGADPFEGKLPGFGPYDAVQVQRQPKKDITPVDADHLRAAIRDYRKAVELDPKSGIYELGLAWLLQETGKVARALPAGSIDLPEIAVTNDQKSGYAAAIAKLGDPDAKVREDASASLEQAMPRPLVQLLAVKSNDPEANARIDRLLKRYFEMQALEHYRKAYSLTVQQDLAKPGGLMQANAVISSEAGDAILEILTEHPGASTPSEEKDLAENLKKLNEKPRAITPIIFAMPGLTARGDGLSDLLDPASRTTFDLAGDDVQRTWPWVKAGTSFLVWDPAHTGQITSGRALFGSATWWISFRDGYEALSILDDNRDGQLTGDELQGISVWTDVNGNGVSEQGEVTPARQAGITAIGVRAAGDRDGVLRCDITFSGGTHVSSFDWVTKPVVYPHPAGK